MLFALEKDMLGPVLTWVKGRGLVSKAEFPTSWGICDVVAAHLDRESLLKRKNLKQKSAITSIFDIAVLDSVPDVESGHSITAKGLAHRLRDLPISRINEALDHLRVSRFVVSPKSNHFQKVNGWIPLHRKLISIELKLNRIDDALSQACNNLRFATESYVALPLDTAARTASSKRIHQFADAGVGIIGVTPSQCRVLLEAKTPECKIDLRLQMLFTERFWRDWLRGS